MPVTKPLRNSNREPTSLYKVLDGVKKAQKSHLPRYTLKNNEIINSVDFLLSQSSSDETDSSIVKDKASKRIRRIKNLCYKSSVILTNNTLLQERKENAEPTVHQEIFLIRDTQSIFRDVCFVENDIEDLNLKRKLLTVTETPLEVEVATHSERATPERKRVKVMSLYDNRHYNHQTTNGTINSQIDAYASNNSKNEQDDNMVNNSLQYSLGGSNSSIATLCNIGNSCYLNSVVYTLRFAPLFLHKLHHLVDDMSQVYHKLGQGKLKSSSLGRHVSGLQGQSGRSWSSKDLASLGGGNIEGLPRNNRQVATEKLHDLYQNLHKNEFKDSGEPINAGIFLHSIQEVNQVFEGNQQQDAHELLLCILDSIRESCIELTKAIKDHPDVIGNGCSTLPEQTEVVLPAHTSQPPQLLKQLFSRKPKRKDTFKANKPGSPLKDGPNDLIVDAELKSSSSSLNYNNADSNGDLTISEDRLADKIKNLGLDFFREDFEGVTLCTTKCLTCETTTEKKEAMIDLSVSISPNENNLIENPQQFFQTSLITRECFKVENQYRCDECCGYTEAVRSVSYELLPRLLVLQLKRFSGGMEKINSYIPTPFVMKCFCNKCVKQTDENKLHTYKLYSVITHVGATMSVGHYIAYTCSLDIYNEYLHCGGKRKLSAQFTGNGNTAIINSPMSGGTVGEKTSSKLKKLMFKNKASSSGDMSKSLKQPINGISKMVINGMEKLSFNSGSGSSTSLSNAHSSGAGNHTTVCQGLNCCGIYVKDMFSLIENFNNSQMHSGLPLAKNCETNVEYDGQITTNHIESDTNKHSESTLNGHKLPTQQTWYKCDDHKIDLMTQREFEELLSPNQKVMVTPYLLFYARYENKKDDSDQSP